MNYLISVVNPGAMERVCEIAAALDLPQTVAMLGHGTAAKSMLDPRARHCHCHPDQKCGRRKNLGISE